MELTIALALGAGLLSFLSPCVLPLVPAYVGQLSAVAVVGRAEGAPSRWLAVRHAIAYVVGFGAVFTVLGITATYAAGPLVRLPADPPPGRRRPAHRARAESRGRAAHPGAGPHVAARSRPARRPPSPARRARSPSRRPREPARGTGARFGDRLGGRIVGARGGWLASFGLGAIFAIGWTPCVGVILGGILTLAASERLRGPGRASSSSRTPSASGSRSCSSRPPTTGRRAFSLPSSAAASSCPRSAASS